MTPVLVRQPVLEQAMAWLVEHGPVVASPPLPVWTLKRLTATNRILRLQRDLFLAPRVDGSLPTLTETLTLLGLTGYVSFGAALYTHGLTDREPRTWTLITDRRRHPLRYGYRSIAFVSAPDALATAETTTFETQDGTYGMATAERAVTDSLDFIAYAPPLPELMQVVRSGLAVGRLSKDSLVARVLDDHPIGTVRLLGLLIELATGDVDQRLWMRARTSHRYTSMRISEDGYNDAKWRLRLPATRAQLISQAAE